MVFIPTYFQKTGVTMLFFLINLTFADPQDIPEDADDTSEVNETSKADDENDAKNKSVEETPEIEKKLEIIDTLKEETNPKNENKELPQALTEEDISLDFLSEANMTESEYSDDNDIDFSWFRGGIDNSLDLRLWDSEGTSKKLWSATFAGDPQYLWELKDDLGPTLGLRFKLSGTESQATLIKDHLIGIIAGFQLKKLRINTSASYMSHHLFHQEELQRNNTSKEVSYLYQELLPLKGMLLEQTLTLALNQQGATLQAFYGTPFDFSENREMGEIFKDSWKAGGNISFSTLSFGYEYSAYPMNQEHIIIFGTSLGR